MRHPRPAVFVRHGRVKGTRSEWVCVTLSPFDRTASGGITMRRVMLAAAVVLLATGCSGPGVSASASSSPSASASPSVTFLPDDVTLSLGAIGADTQKIAHDG